MVVIIAALNAPGLSAAVGRDGGVGDAALRESWSGELASLRYHATDMYRVDPHWGSMEDLQELASALHKRGMKLVLDDVPNHVGPLHPWVQDEPTPNWFHGTAEHHIAGETKFEALIDPHAPRRDRVGTLDGWFVDSLPDMDTDDATVAQYLRQNAVWWIEETGADGLRIDTFPYVGREFWHEYMAELKALYPRLTEVGEVSTEDPVINSSFAEGVKRAGSRYGFVHPVRLSDVLGGAGGVCEGRADVEIGGCAGSG